MKEMPAFESRRVRTQPRTVMGTSLGARPPRMSRTLSWSECWDLEVTADLPREKVVDLSVARDRRGSIRRAVYVYGVLTAFSEELTAMLLEMSEKILALHAARSGKFSRMTSLPFTISSAS